MEEVLHISNEKSKEQEPQSNNAHSKKDFPNKIAWLLVSRESTYLLQKKKKNIMSKSITRNLIAFAVIFMSYLKMALLIDNETTIKLYRLGKLV